MDVGPNPNLRAAILIGLPGYGKTTWARAYLATNPGQIVSSDDYIEKKAEEQGKTYSEIFEATIDEATKVADKNLTDLIVNGCPTIIIDKTNLKASKRRELVSRLKISGYSVYAIVFPRLNPDEHKRRLETRPGKVIPEDAITKMITSYEEPTKAEGFDDIIILPE